MKIIYMLLGATISLLISISAKTQDNRNPYSGFRNYINAYIGIVEYNINYERNLIQKSKSFSNVRLGFGNGKFLTAGEGKYINAALVHLIGKMNSHLEIDLGIKYMVTNSISNPDFSETFIPDLFLGYRFEKPSGGFIFRVGLNYATLINMGIGYRF